MSRVGFLEAVKTDKGQKSTAEAVKSDKGHVSTAEFAEFVKVVKFDTGQETFEWMKTAGTAPEAEEPFGKMRTADVVPYEVLVKLSKRVRKDVEQAQRDEAG